MKLARYQLEELVARGASGEVWRACDASGARVAVKVVRGSRALDASYSKALRHEVRALARLNHAGIAGVLDVGDVSDAAAEASAGRLKAGSPWLAMRFVEGGSLHPLRGRMKWNELRRVLATVLEALAHAHSRGVLHRDIKPANILLGSGDTYRAVLADFGVAHPLGVASFQAPQVAGTPGYMAPEQRDGRWRDFGPWTDLYGLGCTCRALLLGTGPDRRTVRVPREFESWLGHLLADRPEHRYRTAADAARALSDLGPPEIDWLGQIDVPLTGAETLMADSFDLPSGGGSARPEGVVPAPTVGWRRADWVARNDELFAGTREPGVELFALRVPPLVGRMAERERLWEVLGEVASGSCRGVALTGPPGVGKSRLAEWLAETVHERGVANAISAAGSLQDALYYLLGFAGLRGEAVSDRAFEVCRLWALDDPEAPDLVSALFDTKPLLNERDREVGLVRLLSWLAKERPLVLVLDDAHVGWEVDIVRRTLASDERILWLWVGSGAPEGLEPIELLPPDEAEHRAIVDGMLSLEPRLAGQLTRETLGDPRRARAVVESWIEDGRLVSGARGYEVRGEVQIGELDAILVSRLERLVRGRSRDDEHLLQALAVCGPVVPIAEQRGMGEILGLSPSEDLLDAAADVGLLRIDRDGGVQLAQTAASVLRERAEARLQRLHEARAEWMMNRGEPAFLGQAGLHLARAGHLERALVAIREGVVWAIGAAEWSRVEEWILEYRRVGDALEMSPSDPRWGAIAQLEAQRAVASAQGEAERLLERLAADASRYGWGESLAVTHWLRGRLAYLRGQPAEAVRWLERGLKWALDQAHPLLTARCLADRARTHLHQGDASSAVADLLESWDAYNLAQAPVGAVFAAEHLVVAYGHLGDLAGQREWAERVREAGEGDASLGQQADTSILLGEVARKAGRFEEAEGLYHRAMRLYAACSATSASRTVQLNLALLYCANERWSEALTTAERTADLFAGGERPAFVGASHAVALPAAAALGDRASFGRHLARAESMLLRTGFVDPDLLSVLELAHVHAERAGWVDEARRVDLLATDQRRALSPA